MKTLIILVATCLLQPGIGQSRSLRLEVRPARQEVATRDSVTVELRVYNRGSKPARIIAPLNWPNMQLMISVIGPGGEHLSLLNPSNDDAIPELKHGPLEMLIPARSFAGRSIRLSFQPGSRQPRFRFDRRGVYRVFAVMRVLDPQDGSGVLLQSDTAEVVVSQ